MFRVAGLLVGAGVVGHSFGWGVRILSRGVFGGSTFVW